MGNEKYLFVSYAHKDSAVVLPCIEALRKAGINLWYDEGIQAGSEWPEYIAEKVVSSAKVILFISRAYLESQNCKRELNFAISRKKDILSVFIEDVTLSPGVEMQLGTYQAIFRKRYDNDTVFFRSLCNEHWMDDCRVLQANAAITDVPTAAVSGDATPQKADVAGAFNQFVGAAKDAVSSAAANAAAPVTDAVGSFGEFFGATKEAVTKKELPKSSSYRKNRFIAIIIAFLLGNFGVHKFYLGKVRQGLLYLVFFWTGLPFFVALFDIVMLLITPEEKFNQKYNT